MTTTTEERAPRIRALAYDNPGAAQALIEAGAEALRNRDGLPSEVNALISKVLEANTDDAGLEVGQQVSRAYDTSDEPAAIGKVQSRYLNERGDWEYQVYHPRYGTNPYREDEIAPVGR